MENGPDKQRFMVVLIAAVVSLFGFEAASLALQAYQVGYFFRISFYVYIFLVILQTFIFDLNLKRVRIRLGRTDLTQTLADAFGERFKDLKKRHHWLHFQNYLVLPGITYWTTIALIYLNPFDQALKQVFIILTALALSVDFWYLRVVFLAHKDATGFSKQLIFISKFYASYIAMAAAFGITRYFGYGAEWFFFAAFSLSFILMHQALFQHHTVGYPTLKFLFLTGISLGAGAYLMYYFWNANYFSGALVLAAIYNTIWGIIHHKWIDKNLTREMVYEYLAVLFVILVIVFSSTNFAERI